MAGISSPSALQDRPTTFFLHRSPISRDQLILLLVAVNQLFLAIDTYLVHVANGTIRPREAVPIWFGLIAAAVLLLCGLLARWNRPLAAGLATIIFAGSVIVGVLGFLFHLQRGALPTAPVGQRLTLDLLIWAPPVFAPLAFIGVGMMGLSAAWWEQPIGSGVLNFGRFRLPLPLSKVRAYYLYVALGIAVAFVSATLDHARHWHGGALWLPTLAGLFATVVAATMAIVEKPTRTDLWTYGLTMVGLIVVGMIGAWYHIQADLTAESAFVLERFLRGAPVLSPLLYSNMGLIGLVVLIPLRPSTIRERASK